MSCDKSCNIIPNIRTLIEEHYEFFGVFFTFTHHLYSFVYHLFFPFQWMNFHFSSFIAEVKTFLLLLISENAYFVSLNHPWFHLPKRWGNKNNFHKKADLKRSMKLWSNEYYINFKFCHFALIIYTYQISFLVWNDSNIYKEDDNHNNKGEIYCFPLNCHI